MTDGLLREMTLPRSNISKDYINKDYIRIYKDIAPLLEREIRPMMFSFSKLK